MYDPHKRYNKAYVKRNKEKAWRYKEAPITIEILNEHFVNPQSVVDIGCANGVHIGAWEKKGIKTLGIEGTDFFKETIPENYGGPFEILDIRIKRNQHEKYELITCVEVLEHLEEEYAEESLLNILRYGEPGESVWCMTACPVKGGHYHENWQEKDYWIELFENISRIKYQKEETEELQKKFIRPDIINSLWFTKDLMIFR